MHTTPDPEPLWKSIAEGAKRLPPYLLFVVLLLLAFGGVTLFDPQAIGDVRYWLGFGAFAILAELARLALSRLSERKSKLQTEPYIEPENPLPAEPAAEANEAGDFSYDLFISYHRFDQTWVETTLLPYLSRRGLRVFVDFRDFRVGASRIKERERAVLSSRRTLLILTPDYLNSDWAELETILVQGLDPAARDRRVLPIILRPCPLPLRLHNLVTLDMTQESRRPQALARLLHSLHADEPPAAGGSPAAMPAEAHPGLDEAVRRELNAFEITLTEDPAEGARRYLALQNRPEPVWRSPEATQALQDGWERSAPEPLKRLVELWLQRHNPAGLLEVVAQRGEEAVLTSLEWTLQHSLDEDWEQKASELVECLSRAGGLSPRRGGQLLDQNHQRAWKAILRRWKTITYWRLERSIPRDLQLGLFHLGLEVNPFGAERAEEDPLVLNGRYNDLPILTELERSDSHLISAPFGAGQTATALWLAHRMLQSYRAFPIYYPTQAGLDLQSFAAALAEILLRYLAINPPAFLRCGIAGRASLGRLLAQYVAPGDQLILRFHQAGLPLQGAGADLQRQILELTAGAEPGLINDCDELLDVLYEARPHGFETSLALFDGSSLTEIDARAPQQRFQELLALSRSLNQIGVATKLFWTEKEDAPTAQALGMPVGVMKWTAEHLTGLLRMRLAQANEYSLAQWCDPRAGDLAPEERIVAASQNSPARLIYLGNLLLQRIGNKGALLSEADLDQLIKPAAAIS